MTMKDDDVNGQCWYIYTTSKPTHQESILMTITKARKDKRQEAWALIHQKPNMLRMYKKERKFSREKERVYIYPQVLQWQILLCVTLRWEGSFRLWWIWRWWDEGWCDSDWVEDERRVSCVGGGKEGGWRMLWFQREASEFCVGWLLPANEAKQEGRGIVFTMKRNSSHSNDQIQRIKWE